MWHVHSGILCDITLWCTHIGEKNLSLLLTGKSVIVFLLKEASATVLTTCIWKRYYVLPITLYQMFVWQRWLFGEGIQFLLKFLWQMYGGICELQSNTATAPPFRPPENVATAHCGNDLSGNEKFAAWLSELHLYVPKLIRLDKPTKAREYNCGPFRKHVFKALCAQLVNDWNSSTLAKWPPLLWQDLSAFIHSALSSYNLHSISLHENHS